MSCYFIKHRNKSFHFIRNESGRWYDITHCRVLTDGEVANRYGLLLPDAVKVSDTRVAKIVAKSAKAKIRRSNIRRFQKEVV